MTTRKAREPASSDARTAAAIAELQVEVEGLRDDINEIKVKLDQILDNETQELRKLADLSNANKRGITFTTGERKGIMAIAAVIGAVLMMLGERMWDWLARGGS